MDTKDRKLAFLVMTGPDSQDIYNVIGLADAAIAKGIGVDIFMMHRGVLNTAIPLLDALVDKGAVITVCAHNASELKAPRNEKFNYGSQFDHSNIINDATRFLAFA